MKHLIVAAALIAASLTGQAFAAKAPVNDYPTATRVDFVIGCMAANGETRETMLKCACQIDAIAAELPYKTYEMAETALSLQVTGVGGRTGLVRDPPQIKEAIERLRKSQASANLQCP